MLPDETSSVRQAVSPEGKATESEPSAAHDQRWAALPSQTSTVT